MYAVTWMAGSPNVAEPQCEEGFVTFEDADRFAEELRTIYAPEHAHDAGCRDVQVIHYDGFAEYDGQPE